MKEPLPRKPRFKVHDHVRVVGPSAGKRTHLTGIVAEIVGSNADQIFRYRVLFPDGNIDTFFGFELELNQA